MPTKMMHEIFNEVTAVESENEKGAILRKNYRLALGYTLRGIYHPKIKYRYTSLPTYTPLDSPKGLEYSTVDIEIERIYLFEQNNPRRPPALTDARMNELLIQILEALDAREAKIFEHILLKQPIAGLTADMIQKVFPNLLSD